MGEAVDVLSRGIYNARGGFAGCGIAGTPRYARSFVDDVMSNIGALNADATKRLPSLSLSLRDILSQRIHNIFQPEEMSRR